MKAESAPTRIGEPVCALFVSASSRNHAHRSAPSRRTPGYAVPWALQSRLRSNDEHRFGASPNHRIGRRTKDSSNTTPRVRGHGDEIRAHR